MVLRDAVVNDNIPSVAQGGASGYFSYRFGHAVFDYIEERWGREGFLDFIYEFRNTLGARTGRAIERTFRVDPEDFDLDFRRWLRKRYLRELVETGEPSDFGRPFRVEDQPQTQEISAAASPSGDLVAAASAQGGDLDIVLFDAKRRRQIKNLTRGFTTEYQYLVAQAFEVSRRMGRDIAFSPDGNYLAAFARRDEGRDLLLFDVLAGGIARIIPMQVEQQVGLAWSPDGKTIAFSGNQGGAFDLYLLDLETEQLTRLTDDSVFDGSPAFSPDGRSLVFSSVVGEWTKLFRIDLADPAKRYQLTEGESNDRDAIYSPDGKRIYYTSDRGGYDNIFALDLEGGRILQYTDVVTGCFQPAVVAQSDGGEKLVYGGLWDGSFKLYLTDLEATVGEPETVALSPEPKEAAELARFTPAIEVSVDDANKEPYGGFKFFLTDAQTFVGVDDDQTYLAQIYLAFSDYLGDRRIIAILSSYDALSNFDISYWNLSHRWQWGVNLFDDRDFLFVSFDPFTGQIIDRRNEIRQTGLVGQLSYPFGLYTRVEFGLGYIYRMFEFDVLEFELDPDTQQPVPVGFRTVKDEDGFPWLQAALVGDSTIYAPWGPVSGRRWRIDANFAPDIENDEPLPGQRPPKDSSALTSELSFDYRQYFPTTLRSGFAFRLFAGVREGSEPTPFYVGGENIRSFRFRGLSGDRAGFANLEFRFPIIDVLATPFLRFQGIRARVFLDVAAVYYDDFGRFVPEGAFLEDPDFDFWNSDENRLEDGVAVYGLGFTIRFLGLDLNWDIGKRWDGKDTISDFETTFYIGARF
jgi:Tol biopolymer transport system component